MWRLQRTTEKEKEVENESERSREGFESTDPESREGLRVGPKSKA